MKKYLKQGTLPFLQKLSKALGKDLVFVDLETTGFVNAHNFAIIEVGIVMVGAKGILEESSLLDPETRIPSQITKITGITNDMVKGQPTFPKRYLNFFEKSSKDHILVGFNSKGFDSKGIEKIGRENGKSFTFENQLDVRYIFARERNETTGTSGTSGTLSDAKNHHRIHLDGDAHRAGYDIALTAVVLESILRKHGVDYILKEVEKFSCQKTITHFRNNYTEHVKDVKANSTVARKKSTVESVEFNPSKKPNVTNSKANKSTVLKNKKEIAKKSLSSKANDENEEYRQKYLKEKRENAGILGKILGAIFD